MPDFSPLSVPGVDRPAASGVGKLRIEGVTVLGSNGLPAPVATTTAPTVTAAPIAGRPPAPSGRR